MLFALFPPAVALGLLLSLFSGSPVFSGTSESADRPVSVKRVYVRYGDTLWDIAKSHAAPGEDVRAVVHRIKTLNRLRSSAIYEGQVLFVPVVSRERRAGENELDKPRSPVSK